MSPGKEDKIAALPTARHTLQRPPASRRTLWGRRRRSGTSAGPAPRTRVVLVSSSCRPQRFLTFGVLSPGCEQEVLDFFDFARHGYETRRTRVSRCRRAVLFTGSSEGSSLPLLASGTFQQSLTFLGLTMLCSSGSTVVTWPSAHLCVCVSFLIRTPVIWRRAPPYSSMTSSLLRPQRRISK